MSGPVPTSVHADRRRRLIDRLSDDGVDAIIVTSAVNINYLSGFAGSAGALLVSAEATTIASDARYRERAAALAGECAFVETRKPLGALAELALGQSSTVGLEADHLAWSQARALGRIHGWDRLVPLAGLVEGLRASKDPSEVTSLERACLLTDTAVEALLPMIRPGVTETAVARRFVDLILDLGSSGPAFAPIVAFGPHASVPHHVPTTTMLTPGDLIVIDVGAVVEGYHADMSRTLSMGEPPAEWRWRHEAVVEAQTAARNAVAAGVDVSLVDRAARAALAAHGLEAEFIHGTGHGVGLEIHEAPLITEAGTGTLEPFATITVEPGVYRAGVGGIRIEDTVLVTPEGARSLTSLPRDLIVL